ncbi:MAG TPA: glycoside-pentoside-hexuronide (GPH):cation symporter [Tessaracoccus flavescens]|uniref:Glycoside-pentoside-hexuronide (GPH):cation symporter n=1 Tax=Tessaracoccus flavescens TaxID=399497 RepID=A0A921JQM9_9ACTN|nr:glycoside-pentoside-hexuronide (GPH):cation symporter [Tessaracoccus flavescens]
MSSAPISRRNRWSFAVGTVGRDMVYTLMSMFLIVFLTEVLDLNDATMWWVNGILLAARLFDAVTDILMGAIVDNTHSKWGHYKPWIAGGAVASAIITVLLFTDVGLRGPGFIALFTVIYLLWGLAWTANDIPYWSLLPALTLDPVERERIGSLAKVFATIGLFAVVVAIIPVTNALGGDAQAWTVFTVAVVLIMLVGQSVTLFGVKEPGLIVDQERTTLKEVASVVFRNDQLMWTAVSMVLFMTGYVTTTSFGVYFFKYAYGDEAMYSPFAAVLGVGQLLGFALFPTARKFFDRRTLFTIAFALMAVGYVVFFFSPMNIIPIAISGLLLFIGQSFVVVLMLVFISDCIDYGHWKLGRRNGAVTFALQPFINKVGGALATAITGATIILTGINSASGPEDVTEGGLLGMKVMMLVFPLIAVGLAYVVNRAKYKIDDAFHARIINDLRERGELLEEHPSS